LIRNHAPLTGRINIKVFNATGDLDRELTFSNFLTEEGEAYIADQLSDQGETAMSHMAIGDSTGQDRADSTLANETARVALDSTTQGASGDDNDVIYVATFAAGTGTGTVSEVGVLNNSSGGTLLNYSDQFTAFSKGASQSAVITVTITIGSS